MKTILVALGLFFGTARTLQEKVVVHLPPHHAAIDANFGGKLLEVANGPQVISLPPAPPIADTEGLPWVLDIKNLGPSAISVEGKGGFSVRIMAGQTVHIGTNGTGYKLKQ